MAEGTMELWRTTWRKGVAPLLSVDHLEALRVALVEDDERLAQGYTTDPPPLQACSEWDIVAACPLAFCGWQGDHLDNVVKVEEFFARKCWEADQLLGEPAAIRWLLNWVDDTPRDEMRRELLMEVQRSLGEKLAAGATPEERDSVRRASALLKPQ